MKYTPGPWAVDKITGTVIGVCSNQMLKGGTYSTAVCAAIFDTPEEYVANEQNIIADMTLIAKAPEMYDALKSLNAYFVNLQSKVKLDAKDEKAWKKVAKIIHELKSIE